MKKSKYKRYLCLNIIISLSAIIISIVAIIICSFKIHKDASEADYIAIAVTLLVTVVGLAVGNNIYMNLAGTRNMAEDVVNTSMSDYIRGVLKIHFLFFFETETIAYFNYVVKKASQLCN